MLTKSDLKKAYSAIKFASTTIEEPGDFEYAAGMIALLNELGYEAWNEGEFLSIKDKKSNHLIVDKDRWL